MCREILPYCAGLVRNRVQCLEDYGIPLYLSHTITAIRGKKRVEEVEISQVDERWIPIPESKKIVKCDTVLFSVGLIPENEISQKAGVVLDKTNGPEVNELCETNIPGIFAAGNVLQVHDLVDWVTLEAERAGKYAALYANVVERCGKLIDLTRTFQEQCEDYSTPQRIDYLEGPNTFNFLCDPRYRIKMW
jgi:thioredoxin reductase